MNPPLSAIVVMGVAGCGKSCVGAAIASHSGGRLIEGDAFHPAANIQKMSAGIPLDDDDRAGWLILLGEELQRTLKSGARPILTCSALKKRYRDALRHAVPDLGFVFLELSPEEAERRVLARPGHFMPASLIESQFAALEPPHGEPLTLPLDATLPVDKLAIEVDQWLKPCGEPLLARTA
ncbi:MULTISPECIES: gluconokinase [Pseudomonas]|uniref:Gluconokinase n=1 Tax=Pseudomonas donghuensis TaxID=1163398 RepID=A0AAP0SEP5_9PSED|nr:MULTISPECIES: gluconokinase [Pseudomonas]MDF9893791.1 gluconokinase [Pseudomonas vranovensis]KDN97071.2 gluconokinase [Pseudomonas donghuensis]MBF4210753.1 gluconokinase [Pseudomonas donghuensis]MBS7601356.1 gluconokinase [Pseudomonas sp. RC2C2]MCP6692540.1 gluconokinase [Pseudomonas donghuensis]